MAFSKEDLTALAEAVSDGVLQGMGRLPRKDSQGRVIDPTLKDYDEDARSEFLKKLRNQERRDKTEAIQEKIDRIKEVYGEKKGRRKIKELNEEKERIENGGYSKSDLRKANAANWQAAIGAITQILGAALDIFVATQQRLIDLKKAEVEKNVKLTQLGLKQQGSIMSFGMKGITDGFTKNAHEMAYGATQSGYDLAKTMIETSMQMTIASKTYAKDVLQANTKAMGTVIASAAAIGTAVGALIGGIGAPIGAAVGAAIGFVAASWNKIWGLDIQRRQLDIQILEQVTNTMGQYQDTFKQLASGWDDLYKSTSDMVLKINDAGIKFGATIGFGSDKFANTMLKLSNTRVSGNKSLTRLFGNEVDKIPEYMANYMDASQRNVGLNATDLGNIMGTSRLFGMSGSESANLYGAMNIFNTSVSSAADSMGIMYHQITRMGLSSKKFGKDLVQNLKLAEKYNFKGGVENMMKMTKWAQQTRFNLNSATSFAEKLTEGSLSEVLESSAKLQVLGGAAGMYADPLAMMFEAGADVGSLAKRQAAMFNDITGTFNEKTGETEFNWYENRMLAARAQAMGMSVEDARNMIRQSNKQGVIDKQLAGSGLSEEDRLAIGNRATYNKKKGRWEVVDIKGNTHDINEYKNGQANIDELLPADTQESILTVSEKSLSHLEELDNTTKELMNRLGYETQGEVLARASREAKTKYDAMTKFWSDSLAAFRTAGEHSEKMFNIQVQQMQTVAQNLDTLKDIYAGVEKQVEELVTTQFDDIKKVAHAFSLGSQKFYEYINVMVNGLEKEDLAEGVYDKIKDDLDKAGKKHKEEDVLKEAKERYLSGEENIVKPNKINDGYVKPNGESQNFVEMNGIRTDLAADDTVFAAQPNGSINTWLNRLLSSVEVLVNGDKRNNFVGTSELKVNFDGNIQLMENGSVVNFLDYLKNDPSAAYQLINILLRALDANNNGKPGKVYYT